MKLSKRTGMYNNNMGHTIYTICSWLDRKGFRGIKFDDVSDVDDHLKDNEPTYQFGPWDGEDRQTNWISVHNKKIYEMVMWFYDNVEFSECRMQKYENGTTMWLDTDEIQKIIENSI